MGHVICKTLSIQICIRCNQKGIFCLRNNTIKENRDTVISRLDMGDVNADVDLKT